VLQAVVASVQSRP